jgi:hypothetical protein
MGTAYNYTEKPLELSQIVHNTKVKYHQMPLIPANLKMNLSFNINKT